MCPGYDDNAIEEGVGGGTEVAEGEESVYGDDDDPAWRDVSLRSCLSFESCTDGSLRAKTTMALTLPCQCCCSMKSILKTMAMTNSSSEMLSTTMAVQRLYYDYTVSDDRVAKGKFSDVPRKYTPARIVSRENLCYTPTQPSTLPQLS